MQRRDVAIILVGAALVLAATAYVGLAGPGTASLQASPFLVTYPVTQTATELQPAGQGSPVGAFTVTAARNVTQENVTSVRFEGHVSGQVLPPTASMHATLQMPNGSKLEKDASPAPGGSSMDVAFDVPLTAAPANRTVDAPSLADANAMLPAPSEAGRGAWTLTLSVSMGAPNVVPFAVTARAVVSTYAATVAPAVPTGK
jgi:hypothetical protein